MQIYLLYRIMFAFMHSNTNTSLEYLHVPTTYIRTFNLISFYVFVVQCTVVENTILLFTFCFFLFVFRTKYKNLIVITCLERAYLPVCNHIATECTCRSIFEFICLMRIAYELIKISLIQALSRFSALQSSTKDTTHILQSSIKCTEQF